MRFALLAAMMALAGTAPIPRLVDQSGAYFTLGSLRGKPLVVTFVSAHCTDACPLIDGAFAAAAEQIAGRHISARLLTITLDPEHDSPRVMQQLARRFAANRRYWLLASGTPADVHAIMRWFGVVAVQGRDGYADRHTTFVYVFNADGKLEQTMLASTALSAAIVDAVARRSSAR